MLLSQLDSLLPSWMLSGKRRYVGAALGAIAATLDAVTEAVYQARFAAHPGQVNLGGVEGLGGFDSVDALPLIGRDRMIRRGLAETPWDYAERLRKYRDAWAQGATPAMLLEQLAGILSPSPPVLRLVSTGGTWWTRATDGTLTQCTFNETGIIYNPITGAITSQQDPSFGWDWDSQTVPAPADQGDINRFWLVIYAPCNLPFLATDDGTFADDGVVNDFADAPTSWPADESPQAGTIGTVSPWRHVELVRTLVQEWRAAGLSCAYVIVTFDPTAFDPMTDSTPTSRPDGWWGWHTKPVAGVRVPARYPNAYYWPGNPGGVW